MIEIVNANLQDLSIEMLDDYKRYTKTTHVHYIKDGSMHIKEEVFEESWDTARLRDIASYLIDCKRRGGTVLLATENSHVIGFSNLERQLYFDHYINMPYIHVSQPYRGKGIGKMLFQRIKQEAVKYNAKALYISAHPSVEAQAFYTSLGCVLAKRIIPELYEKEPLDIQLEMEL